MIPYSATLLPIELSGARTIMPCYRDQHEGVAVTPQINESCSEGAQS
jgi:hypothetical protein